MKKIILGLVAATAVAAPLAMSAPADAATSYPDGTVTVTKGDIQSAMGWNNGAWDTAIGAPNGVTKVGNLITASDGVATPVDVPGGWLTLNGQIVANYPSDEYYDASFTNPENWCPTRHTISSYWENSVNTVVTPIKNAQNKVTGYKVTAAPSTRDGYVYFTRHSTFDCDVTHSVYGTDDGIDNGNGVQWQYHATSRWPASVAGSGSVSDVKVNGKAVTVTPTV